MTIAIVDYGAGNLTSVKKALDSLGSRAIITSDAEQISGADKLIVPGVGHFAATAALQRNGMLAAIQAAIRHETPLLGICLGMQWLCAASTEAPELAGLNIFAADCTHFPSQVKAPHVGWNDLEVIRESGLLTGLPQRSFVYFAHSYRVPLIEHTVASCEYGGVFSAVVEQGRIFGVQFHPEKSGTVGKKILENFCELPC
ncbi:MAG: imidazole glycerol phosphate synthase subunit HisH [Acidobacteria bacterium]|nr:MAG: imidazole glycerol phosphate synthase subunit HisH [Acidobacteriota bacterium]